MAANCKTSWMFSGIVNILYTGINIHSNINSRILENYDYYLNVAQTTYAYLDTVLVGISVM